MKFTLQKWNEKFVPDVAEFADNPDIARNLRNVFPSPYTYADAEWYVNDCISKGDRDQLCRAVVADNRAVGSVGLFLQQDVCCKSAELGYWLAEPYWGQGIMTSAVRQLCETAFKTFDIIRIYAEPFAYNTGSRRVLEKAGFTLEGILRNSIFKNGKVYDACMYALLKEEQQSAL